MFDFFSGVTDRIGSFFGGGAPPAQQQPPAQQTPPTTTAPAGPAPGPATAPATGPAGAGPGTAPADGAATQPGAQPGAPNPQQAAAPDPAVMQQAAADIFRAVDGMGTDEDAIHRALRGRSPAEVDAIRA